MAAAGNVQSIAQQKSNPNMVQDPVPTMADQTQQLQDTMDERNYPVRDMASVDVTQQEQPMDQDMQAVDQYLVEQFLAQQMGGEESVESGEPGQLQAEQIQPISESLVGANLNVKEQLEVLPARIRASFGRTAKEKQSALETFLGKDNVRAIPNSDNFMVKLPGKDKFRKLDPETFDIVGDLFADNYRDSIAQMMGIGGGTLAVAAQGPAALEPVTTGVGFAAGYAGGAALGDATADMIAENVLGIPRDPIRGGVAQAPEGGGEPGFFQNVEAGVERTLDNVTYGMTSAVFDQGLKKVTGVLSDRFQRRAEMRAAIRKAKEIPEHEKLKPSVINNMATLKELQAVDSLKNLPGTDMPVLAHQMLPDTKDARMIAESLANSKEFQTMQTQASKQVGDLILDMVDTAADLGEGKMKQTILSGAATPKPGLQQNVTQTISKVFDEEGHLIDQFRAIAGAKANGVPVEAPKTMEFMKEVVEKLKIRPNPNGKGFMFMVDDTGKESFDDLAAVLGTDSKTFINSFKNDISKMLMKMGSRQRPGAQPAIGSQQAGDIAGFNVDDLISMSKLVGNKNPVASRIGGKMKYYVGRFSSALREDAGEATKKLLDPENAERFTQSMSKFKVFKEAGADLENMLNTDMGANTFVHGLLNSGKSGLQNLKAAKAILREADPKVWDNVRSQFFEEIALKTRKLGADGGLEYDVKKMRSEIMKYGDEFLEEMFPKQNGVNNVAMLRKTLDVAEQLQRTLVKGTDDEVVKVAKEAARGMSQFVSAKINSAMSIFGFMTQDNRLMKLMSQRGVDEFLEKVPKGKWAALKSGFQAVLDYGRGQGMIKMLSTMEGPMGRAYGTGIMAPEFMDIMNQTGGALRSEIPR